MLMVTKGESYFNIHWNLRKTEEDSRNLFHQLPFDDGSFKGYAEQHLLLQDNTA